MKRLILLALALPMLFACANAQTARKLKIVNSADGESTLEVFLPENPSGRAVVDCPGGGYSHLAMQHEGYDWAEYFNKQGIALCVLKYRMPKGDRNIPLSDAYNAIKTVRDSAAQWHINPHDVGIMGFSAGGHLASSVSTHAPFYARPDFSILVYPVISMDERETHKGSCVGFLGEGRNDKALVKEWSNYNAVRRHLTPPAILLMAADDRVVPPLTNGMKYYEAMRRCGNECAMYIYPSGGHGFGFRSNYTYHDQMLYELTTWLKNLPSAKADAQRVACIGNSITDGSGIDMAEVNGYPAQLQKMLGKDYYVKNFGVSARTMLNKGDHPYMKELAWKDALAFNPNIVVIKLGTNDSKDQNWKYGNEYEADMQHMIDSLKALPAKPRICIATPIPAFKPSWTINDSVIVNGITPIIYKLAQKNKLEVIDLHSAFKDNDGKQMQRDGIHPTENGAKQMATIIAATLKSEPKVVTKAVIKKVKRKK